LIFHRYPRFTATLILDVLTAFGFGGLGISEHNLLEPGRIVQLGQSPNRIDILTSISAVDFEATWLRTARPE